MAQRLEPSCFGTAVRKIAYEENEREFSFIWAFDMKDNSKNPILRLREVE